MYRYTGTPFYLDSIGMDGERSQRWRLPSVQIRFSSKLGEIFIPSALDLPQRVPGQPPLQIKDEEEADDDDASDEDSASLTA